MIRHYDEIKGTKQKLYETAICKGYLTNYNRAWRHSFVGAFVMKHPRRINVLDRLQNILSHEPTWKDLTDANLKDLKDCLSDSVCQSTLHTMLGEIKAFINENRWEHRIPSKGYKRILTVRNEISQSTFLSEREVKRIYHYLPCNKSEMTVKRIFLIECLTGARFSDACRLSIANVRGDMLQYVQQKTKREVILPLHRGLIPLLEENETPCHITSKMNATLRTICRKCGIKERMTPFRHGENITAEKWQFITSHCGRKSFATNLYLRGVDILTISRMMGHSSVKMTERYIVGNRKISPAALKFFREEL